MSHPGELIKNLCRPNEQVVIANQKVRGVTQIDVSRVTAHR
jgi:hypothetical protein